jgi:aspartyl-tRNA(Asn)/glutamyl-tRNA(Gln) amidotransferase subunit A
MIIPPIARLRAIDERYHVFAEIAEGQDEGEASFHFSAKDNLCAQGLQARAGSKILEGYRPPFDATPIRRLKESGGVLLGKTNMDEFGFGTFSTNSAYGIPRNPFDPHRACGGSSGGAAAAACLIEDHLALGVSTGGSISCPASFCGVVGLTPTYGRVSRHGLIDYANSLDKVGLLARSTAQIERHLPIIAGKDPKDPTSCIQTELSLNGFKVESVAVPEEAMKNLDPGVEEKFSAALKTVKNNLGIEVRRVSMPSLKYALSAYYVIATSEASTNLARYCGMRFGAKGHSISQHFNDFFSEIRSERFGQEAKRRILIGTYARMAGYRDRYYAKALAVRQTVIAEYDRMFQQDDLVLTPTMPFVAPLFDDIARMRPLEAYQADFLTVPPNLTGMPHISVPCGYLGALPVGMQFVAPHWREGMLLDAARRWEQIFPYEFPEAAT